MKGVESAGLAHGPGADVALHDRQRAWVAVSSFFERVQLS
jgi:hypothetical protein